MQFPTPVVTEITAPNNVPFAPGNNVAGFGSDIPAELTAAGYVNAIVFYSSTWNPLATVPTIKFRFIATNQTTGDLILGYGICANPSVSQTAVVTTGLDLKLQGIVAPGGGTFAPGNAVTGIGTDVPAELVAAGYPNAIVFYSTNWNPLNSSPQAKYFFMAAKSDGTMTIGNGYVSNATVSQTAVVTNTLNMGIADGVHNQIVAQANSGSAMFRVAGGAIAGNTNTQLVLAQDGAPFFDVLLFAFSGQGTLQAGNSTDNGVLTLGQAQLFGQALANPLMQLQDSGGTTTATLVKDAGWTSLPLVNGWTGDATRVPLYRAMPDGTIQMKGYIFKAANPVNGEQWMNALPSSARPFHTWSFLTATPGRPANTGQIVEIHSDGVGIIYDMAALSGSISLDSVRFAVI